MVRAAAGNLPEQNQNNKCVNRPPGTAVKKYAGTHDLPCTTARYEMFDIPGTGRRLVNSSGEIVKGRKVTDGNDQKWEVSSGGAIRVYGSDETAEIVAPEATTSY